MLICYHFETGNLQAPDHPSHTSEPRLALRSTTNTNDLHVVPGDPAKNPFLLTVLNES